MKMLALAGVCSCYVPVIWLYYRDIRNFHKEFRREYPR